jgi:hypothetical protein
MARAGIVPLAIEVPNGRQYGEGFEPSPRFRGAAFQAAAFNHSATRPSSYGTKIKYNLIG